VRCRARRSTRRDRNDDTGTSSADAAEPGCASRATRETSVMRSARCRAGREPASRAEPRQAAWEARDATAVVGSGIDHLRGSRAVRTRRMASAERGRNRFSGEGAGALRSRRAGATVR
jgi:hypothetical protein